MSSGRPLIGGQDPERELAAFASLRRCILDSSSAIYMRKAGFLELLGATLELVTIPGVIEETGFTDMPVSLLEPERPVAAETDSIIVAESAARSLPVITEDRKMMLRLDAAKVPFFNSLMMLHLLLFREKLDPFAHEMHYTRLLAVCRYSDRVLAYGREVFQAVLKYR